MYALTLLKSALALLMFLSALGDQVPPDVHDAVMTTANNAISEAITELQAENATSTATTTPMAETHSGSTGGSTGGSTVTPDTSVQSPSFQLYQAVYEAPADGGRGDDFYIWGSQDFSILSVTHNGDVLDSTVVLSKDVGEDSCIFVNGEKKCGGFVKRITTSPAISTFPGELLNVTTDSGLVVPFVIP